MLSTLRIATRKSPLALWQAEYVKGELHRHHPELNVELIPLSTQGDEILNVTLSKVGGKGLFVKELEHALLNDVADIAVHSMKDVPMVLPEGFELPVICERENPFDGFVSNEYSSLDALPNGAIVGTSSLRRQSQLLAARPDLTIEFLRGNVGTRLGKLDSGQYQAIILACAGLVRLGLGDRIAQSLDRSVCLPAVGQGAVGIETRAGDAAVAELLAPLNHDETALRVKAERAMNRALNGSCSVPIAGYATLDGTQLTLEGRVGSSNGQTLLVSQQSVEALPDEQGFASAERLGTQVAADLMAQGAGALLAAL